MNRYLFAALLLLIALLFVVAVKAQPSPIGPFSVTLAWDKSPGTNVITNYNAFYGVASRTYTNEVRAGTNTTVTVSNLLRGPTYFFAATAQDTNGLESDYSAEVFTNVPAPPRPVTALRIISVSQ